MTSIRKDIAKRVKSNIKLYQQEEITAEMVNMIYQLALLGVTQEKAASIMGVGIDCFAKWLREDKSVKNAWHEGRDVADSKVALGWYKRATGYDYDEQHVSCYRGQTVVTMVRRHIPPDSVAAERWLANRQRELWSQAHRADMIQNNQFNINNIDLSGLSDEQLLMMEKALLSQKPKDAGGH